MFMRRTDDMTATRVVLGAMAMGSMAVAAALIWLLIARPGTLLSLVW
jgi:hypothetical protein